MGIDLILLPPGEVEWVREYKTSVIRVRIAVAMVFID